MIIHRTFLGGAFYYDFQVSYAITENMERINEIKTRKDMTFLAEQRRDSNPLVASHSKNQKPNKVKPIQTITNFQPLPKETVATLNIHFILKQFAFLKIFLKILSYVNAITLF